jgi:hypothetical protein
MSVYDLKVPDSLKDIQEWFGKAIRQRVSTNFQVTDIQSYIASTEELNRNERMQLYNEAYWYRLIDALQEEFPMLVRLFGEDNFTRTFAIDYLDKCPPRHWSLNLIGDRFLSWLEASYQGNDKKLVEICASIDWTCQHIFLAKSHLPLVISDAKTFVSSEIALQPTVQLLSLPGHFMKWRKELLEQPADYWQHRPFPQLIKDRTYYFIIYRSFALTVEWEEVSLEKYLLLKTISELGTIERATDSLEEMECIDQEVLEKNIVGWIQAILECGWLYSCLRKI